MGKGKNGRPMTLTDFMPQFDQRHRSAEEVGQRLMVIAQASHFSAVKAP